MKRKFSIYSLLLIIIGIFMSIMSFPPLNITFLGWTGIFIGFSIYLLGIVLGFIAIYIKEKGFLKYISVISILFGIVFVTFIFAIVGQV
ncbi:MULTISPECIES: hypothetical protein [Sporosarcina]|uniref:Uncharacterized protein n=1 Tax=Sporosarcina psychrophila TaxID=1476 RepID=A0ABV2K7A5_SPOPS|nr:hypothetical protein [Sporosarcina psychrophila]AMQ06419.1 hypothetical protein AZE41_11050 [Sporosarcina psychrophila]